MGRNQEDNTTKFPDIIGRLPKCLTDKVESAVLDCEAVAWDREKKQIQPFQVLSTRKRKDAVEEEIKVQVCLFGFDLLYLNGEALVTKPFKERRELLRNHFKAVEDEFQYAKFIDGNTTEEIQEALEESIKDNCEGLMVKTLDVDATYEIARRSHNWLKMKSIRAYVRLGQGSLMKTWPSIMLFSSLMSLRSPSPTTITTLTWLQTTGLSQCRCGR